MELIKELDFKIGLGPREFVRVFSFVRGDPYEYTGLPSFYVELEDPNEEEFLFEISQNMIDWNEPPSNKHFYAKIDKKFSVSCILQELINKKVIKLVGEPLPCPLNNFQVQLAEIL